MEYFSIQKKLSLEMIEAAKQSVSTLNEYISEFYPPEKGFRLITWASDLHIHKVDGYDCKIGAFFQESVDTRRQFTLTLHEINSLALTPELLILGGDISDKGLADEFLAFDSIMKQGICSVPTIPLFGNHDNPGYAPINPDMIQIWSKVQQPGWPDLLDPNELFYSIVINGIQYVILDTLESPNYKMSEKQLTWLEEQLKAAIIPVIVLCHRHQLPVGNWVDECSMFRDKRAWELIDRCEQVLGVFSGHVHLPRVWQYRRKMYGTFPSTAYGIGAGTGWGGIILNSEGIAAVFYKELYGESFDPFIGLTEQAGKFVFMSPELFQNHCLFNPCYWPWERDPLKRD